MHCAGTNGNAWRDLPLFTASYKSCNCGDMKLQSSSTCCSLAAMPVA